MIPGHFWRFWSGLQRLGDREHTIESKSGPIQSLSGRPQSRLARGKQNEQRSVNQPAGNVRGFRPLLALTTRDCITFQKWPKLALGPGKNLTNMKISNKILGTPSKTTSAANKRSTNWAKRPNRIICQQHGDSISSLNVNTSRRWACTSAPWSESSNACVNDAPT